MSSLKDLPKKHQVTIGFSKPKHPTIISRIIMAIEKTPSYSHVYSKTRANSLGRTIVYHASEHNLHFMNFDDFAANNIIHQEFTFNVTAEKKKEILQFCIDKSGRRYGKREFFGIGLARLARMLGLNMANPFRRNEFTMVCSELAGHILKMMDEDFDVKLLEIEGPKFIYNRCMDMLQRKAWNCERLVFVDVSL